MASLTVLSYFYFFTILVTADIPGIPQWAQDLAKCAPGSPSNTSVSRWGLFHRKIDQSGSQMDMDENGRRGLLGLHILNRNQQQDTSQSQTDPVEPIDENDDTKRGLLGLNLLKPLFPAGRQKRMADADQVSGGINIWPFIGRFEFAELQNWFPRNHMISNVGTLISPSLVLTARHVIDNIDPAYQTKVTKIYFGSSSRWTVSLMDTTRTISEIYFFPNDMVDLAILRLTSPVTCRFSKAFALAPLAKDSLDKVYKCKSASWGKDENGQCPENLKEGSFRLFKQKHPYEICARGFNKTLTNVGDSGMPLMCKDPKTGNWLQYGVFSFDYWTSGGYKVSCFVAVNYCYQWIQQRIAEADDQADIDDFKSKCPAPTSFD